MGTGGGELQSHGGEHSNRGAEAKVERFPHRGLVQPELTSLRSLSAHLSGRWGLGDEAWASEVRPQGEDWGWLREHSLKGASVTQLAGRESRKKSGPAREARDHCFRVSEERGFLLRVPTGSRAPPKQAPETGVSCSYHLGPQRQTRTATTAATATKGPVCKHRSLPTPSREPVQHAIARIP